MKNFHRLFMCLMMLKFDVLTAETLYAASVHWRPFSDKNATMNSGEKIVLSYKLIWQQGSLPRCPKPNNQTLCYFYKDGTLSATSSSGLLPTARWQGYKWKCTGGCANSTTITNLSTLYYTDVGTFHEISWEAAMELVVFTFNSKDDLANLEIGLYDSSDQPVDGLGKGMFNMAVRNDTNRANISPAINPIPYYRVPLGCSINVPLFPFDGDGDYVRCHWQKFPSPGTNKASAVLKEDKCEIHIHADPKKGYQAGQSIPFSLFAEDYSKKPVQFSKLSEDITTGPFSRTPVKFLVYISAATNDCKPGPNFIEAGTLSPNHVGSYPLPFTNAKLPFKIPTDDGQVILTSGPRYMGFKRNNDTDTIEGTWAYINDTSMTGIHQACGMAYTKHGVPGESRCGVLLVNEPDECPCPVRNGIVGECRNLFEYNTCEYPPQPVTNQQQQNSCKPVKPIKEADDNLGIRVGLPVGLSLLLLIIIIATAMYLKQHYVNKMKKSSVNPEHLTNGIAKANLHGY